MSDTTARPLADLTIDEIVAKIPHDPYHAMAFYAEQNKTFKEVSRELLLRVRGITKENVHGDKLHFKAMRQLAGLDFYIIGFSAEGEKENHVGLRHRPSGFIASYPLCY